MNCTIELGDVFEFTSPMKKSENPFFKGNYFCGILISTALPDCSNPGYPELRRGRPKAQDWAQYLKKQPIKNIIDLSLFYIEPDLLKTCKHCRHTEIVLTHVVKDTHLTGVCSCTNCGARSKTAALPTPKLIAEVICELKKRNYSTNLIQSALLTNFDVSVSLVAMHRILNRCDLNKASETIAPTEIVEIVKNLKI